MIVVSHLLQASRAELLYVLNFSCVVSLPFIALLFGELPALEAEMSKRGTVDLIFSLFIMVSLLKLVSLWHSQFLLEKYSQNYGMR